MSKQKNPKNKNNKWVLMVVIAILIVAAIIGILLIRKQIQSEKEITYEREL